MEKNIKEFAALALDAAFEAGKEIMRIYENAIEVDIKGDGSPLTEADRAAHKKIVSMLAPSNLPVLSEEGRNIPFEERKEWKLYWLVDPLDGTKEFIKRNGEFTVNIALMKDNQPIAGVVYQPVAGKAFVGIEGDGLYKFSEGDKSVFNNENKIKSSSHFDDHKTRIIASRSHKSAETESFIEGLKSNGKKIELLNRGSSLKFCVLAEGEADIYPRFAPTMEWDTAAGHALLKSVGKNIYLHPGGKEMTYNKPQLVNDWFIAK